jgi:hypothetical protein
VRDPIVLYMSKGGRPEAVFLGSHIGGDRRLPKYIHASFCLIDFQADQSPFPTPFTLRSSWPRWANLTTRLEKSFQILGNIVENEILLGFKERPVPWRAPPVIIPFFCVPTECRYTCGTQRLPVSS